MRFSITVLERRGLFVNVKYVAGSMSPVVLLMLKLSVILTRPPPRTVVQMLNL